MKKITLTTKEQLKIYMSPVRQQLLRQLNISGTPLNPKMLADKLQISASGVQHHIKKLMSLGLVELDHTEVINGITASFYKPTQVIVQVGMNKDDGLTTQREALMQEAIAQVYSGFRMQRNKNIKQIGDRNPESLKKWGEILTGIAYLSKQESENLLKLIDVFIQEHAQPKNGNSPWEYALIAYNAEEVSND